MDASDEQGLAETLRALSYAARAHRSQTLPDGVTPYYAHPARVTWTLRHGFGITDAATLTAGALHDVLEDTPVTSEELAREFGPEIVGWVQNLSKSADLPEAEAEEDYVARLRKAPEPVGLVKLADLHDNLTTRRGTPKVQKTLRNAHRYLEAVDAGVASVQGRAAFERVRRLVAEVERETSQGNAPAQG